MQFSGVMGRTEGWIGTGGMNVGRVKPSEMMVEMGRSE